jgi:hypothetical protein
LETNVAGSNIEVKKVATPIAVIVFIIAILILKGVQNGSMNFTAKKLILGLIITIIIINITMFFLM